MKQMISPKRFLIFVPLLILLMAACGKTYHKNNAIRLVNTVPIIESLSPEPTASPIISETITDDSSTTTPQNDTMVVGLFIITNCKVICSIHINIRTFLWVP